MKKRAWFARVVWADPDGGIVEEHKFKTKHEAKIFQAGFESGRLHFTDSEDDRSDMLVDVTTRTKLIEG